MSPRYEISNATDTPAYITAPGAILDNPDDAQPGTLALVIGDPSAHAYAVIGTPDQLGDFTARITTLTRPEWAVTVDAASTFAEVCTTALTEHAAAFTCTEIETLAALYRALGETDTADRIIARHAADDEPGEQHHTEPPTA